MVTYSMSSANCALVLGNRPFPRLLFYHPQKRFDLECHGQASVKVELIMFGFVFMKFKKLRSLYRENKKHDLNKI